MVPSSRSCTEQDQSWRGMQPGTVGSMAPDGLLFAGLPAVGIRPGSRAGCIDFISAALPTNVDGWQPASHAGWRGPKLYSVRAAQVTGIGTWQHGHEANSMLRCWCLATPHPCQPTNLPSPAPVGAQCQPGVCMHQPALPGSAPAGTRPPPARSAGLTGHPCQTRALSAPAADKVQHIRGSTLPAACR